MVLDIHVSLQFTGFLCLWLASGRVMLKHPPKEINNFFGYRTAMSRKNRDTWDFAHALFAEKYGGKQDGSC